MTQKEIMPRQILFLCTGNYYRSRFAEIVFNLLAKQMGIDYVATSRALALELGIFNFGPISSHTRRGLAARGIPLPEPVRRPMQCDEADLQSAYRVIALKEAEHRRYLTERYPDWPDRVEYWHVHDLDQATPEQALAEIERNVTALVEQLRREDDRTAGGRQA
jgi:protein-tyrosine phosphatase